MNDSTALNFFEAPNTLRLLEIVVENGKGLQKDVHRTHSLKAYPVVFIDYKDSKEDYDSQKQKLVDLNGGSNPVWNAYGKFIVDTDEARQKKLYLFVRVNSKRIIRSGSKLVGEVSVAIEELLNNFGDAVDWKSDTRSVKNKKGEEHGSVSFKYKFGRPHDPQLAASLSQPADRPLPQPANGNAVAEMGNNNSQSILRGLLVLISVADLGLDFL